MARFKTNISDDLYNQLKGLENNTSQIFKEMCRAGAEVVRQNVVKNMKKSFKTTESLEKGLIITRDYRTKSDDAINVKVGFYGYDGIPTKQYPKGTPIPLKAMAREYGTSQGEEAIPFFKQSFQRKDIEVAMQKVLDKYLKGQL